MKLRHLSAGLLASTLVLGTTCGTALAQGHGGMEGGGHAAHGGDGKHGGAMQGGGKHAGGKHGGGKHGGGKHGGGHKGHHGHHEPGAVIQVCKSHGPAFCEPHYRVKSAVPGLVIDDVALGDPQTLVVKIREVGVLSGGVGGPVVLVGGAGKLAGAALVEGGWQGETLVQLRFAGPQTLYEHGAIHLHLFPVTGR